MPYSLMRAVEETVVETLRQGLYGWQVTDCVVTLTRSGYWPRQSHAHGTFDKSMSSTAGDFRNPTPLVLMAALRRAGTTVYEPMHRFRLELPADALGPVLPVLGRLRAVPGTPVTHGGTCVLESEVPAARVHEMQQLLPALTRGEGVLESAFATHRPVRGQAPEGERTDHNPLDRKEYLLHTVRRIGGWRERGAGARCPVRAAQFSSARAARARRRIASAPGGSTPATTSAYSSISAAPRRNSPHRTSSWARS